jgi:hypothetical protein
MGWLQRAPTIGTGMACSDGAKKRYFALRQLVFTGATDRPRLE